MMGGMRLRLLAFVLIALLAAGCGKDRATSAVSSTTTGPTITYRLTGGTVGVRCDGNDVSLVYATPNDGYVTIPANVLFFCSGGFAAYSV